MKFGAHYEYGTLVPNGGNILFVGDKVIQITYIEGGNKIHFIRDDYIRK